MCLCSQPHTTVSCCQIQSFCMTQERVVLSPQHQQRNQQPQLYQLKSNLNPAQAEELAEENGKKQRRRLIIISKNKKKNNGCFTCIGLTWPSTAIPPQISQSSNFSNQFSSSFLGGLRHTDSFVATYAMHLLILV